MSSLDGSLDSTPTHALCCNNDQYNSLFLTIAYMILIFKLWRLVIIHPFKILTVFLHELGHASAAWATGGKVLSMEVHPNEGGVTQTTGGIQWIILSAGYINSGFWGMALIVASGRQLAAEIMAVILIFFLLLFVYYAGNAYMRYLNIGFTVVLIVLMLLNIYTEYDPLQYMTLFLGVMSCLFCIYDIWDDLLSRRVNESDASVFARLTHTSSRCWGAIWGLIAVISLVVAVYLHLYVTRNSGPPLSFPYESSMSKRTKISGLFACVTIILSVAHTAKTGNYMVRKYEEWGYQWHSQYQTLE